MASVKDIIVKPINATAANEFVKKHHYSGKVVPNSQLHFGCFLNGVLGGVMQFGPSLDKKKVIGLVKNTGWNDFLELNRMAFGELLPKNAESRCLAIAMRMIKKNYPNIKWIVSFADGCQCGDGTIYRASGFKLTQIKRNTSIRRNPKTGELMQDMQAFHLGILKEYKTWEKITGNMLRYVYFLDKSKEKDLTVPVLPFNMIDKYNARMYKGQKYVKDNACLVQQQNGVFPDKDGGATPTDTHQDSLQ